MCKWFWPWHIWTAWVYHGSKWYHDGWTLDFSKRSCLLCGKLEEMNQAFRNEQESGDGGGRGGEDGGARCVNGSGRGTGGGCGFARGNSFPGMNV